MADAGYFFMDKEERAEQYQEFMAGELYQYYGQASRQAMELFHEGKEAYRQTFCAAIASANEFLQACISGGRKEQIKYIHFSYLLSGALSGEMLVKLDFYDWRYYRDTEEADCFWDCRELFPECGAAYRRIGEEMHRNVIRVQSRELSQLRIGLAACNYLALKPIIVELAKDSRVEEMLRPYCAAHTFLLYGSYLDESVAIHQLSQEGA